MAITTNGKVSITNLQVGSSADLAGIISDESGTGVLAFTTSPTFTTPTLGTASATAIELGHASDTTLSRSSAGVLAVEGTAVLLSGGALGTPSSGNLTNATGLPVSGITASTSTAIGVGTIELGHATDTTISRVSAGLVAVEGVNVVTESASQTLTNKTISGASNTLTVRLDNTDVTGTLVTTKGGTGLATYTTGDVVYASASNTLAKLAIGTSGQTLSVSSGGIVEWTTPSAGTTANDQAFAFAVQVFS